MSTVTLDEPTARPVRHSARRAWAMSRGELRLLWRNKTAMFTALAMPIVMVVILYSVNQSVPRVPGTFMAAALIGFALLLVVYVNLVSTPRAGRSLS